MNFEYGTLGNHEFDEGLGEFNRIMKGEAPTPGQFNKIVDEYPHEASKQEGHAGCKPPAFLRNGGGRSAAWNAVRKR